MKRCEKCGAKFPVCGSRVFGEKVYRRRICKHCGNIEYTCEQPCSEIEYLDANNSYQKGYYSKYKWKKVQSIK